VQGSSISWPDDVTVAPDGSVYVTSSQIHRSTMLSDTDEEVVPALVEIEVAVPRSMPAVR